MIHGRVTAEREEPFVVFLIGMRLNKLRAVRQWAPMLLKAPRMVREARSSGDGLLGKRTWVSWRSVAFVQYWESVDALRRYARHPDRRHLDDWQWYNSEVAGSDAVGIWHETYRVDPEDFEAVYNRMPPWGLGAADGVELVDATEEQASMFGRLGRTDGSDVAVTADGEVVEES